MALTKVGKEGVVGLDNSADATAINIDSSERIGIGASNNSSYDANARNVLIADESGSSGLTIRSGGSSTYGMIHFADGVSSAAEYRAGRIIYEHSSDSMQFSTANTQSLVIDSIGAITKPRQPAFLAKPSSAQNNLTNDPAGVDLVFGTEVFDQNDDFASNTFTAPVTGRYNLFAHIYLYNLDSAANVIYITLQTSNRSIFGIIDPDFGQDNEYWYLPVSMLCDMDANDTAKITWLQSGGTAQTNLQPSSYFGGHLAC